MSKQSVYLNTNEQFIDAVKTSSSVHEALKKLGLNPFGKAYTAFQRRCKELDCDTSHFGSDKSIRKRTDRQRIIQVCGETSSRRGALTLLQLNPDVGSNVRWIDEHILNLSIDTSHWTGQGHLKGRSCEWSKKPLESWFEKADKVLSPSAKQRIVSQGFLPDVCSECGITEWHGKKLRLQLDHKDGDNTNNVLENLRLLCPNCHSLTPTFCRKKSAR